MKLLKWIALIVIATAIPAQAQKADSIGERLARLDEGQKAIHQRIDDVNKRIDDLRADMNGRFDLMNKRLDDINRKFNWLYILLAAVIALNGAMVGSVIWLARQERPIGQRQYDEILDRQMSFERELREVKLRLENLEKT